MRSDPIRHCSQLSRRGEKILIALLEHPTHEKAAAAAGISPVTVSRWLKNPKFQKALTAARRDVYTQSMARIHQATAAAAATVAGGPPGVGVALFKPPSATFSDRFARRFCSALTKWKRLRQGELAQLSVGPGAPQPLIRPPLL